MGESTFMVEMNEASDILNNMTSRSLVLFRRVRAGYQYLRWHIDRLGDRGIYS